MLAGGEHHPSTPTFGVSAGAVNPMITNSPHTGAGFFIVDKRGWLAGAGGRNIWQSFGGNCKENESPWQTASREMLEETGIPSEHLVSLAPPFRMCKDDHTYVLHIATIRSTHRDSTFPMVTSQELTRFRHFTSFGDAFQSELGDGEIVHRRDIEPAFLAIAADIYRAISMQAQASPTSVSPRPASGGSSVGASIAVDALANEFASNAEPPSLMPGDEEWPLDDDDSAVDATQPSSEIVRTSPPLGTSPLATPPLGSRFLGPNPLGSEFFGPHPSVSSSGHWCAFEPHPSVRSSGHLCVLRATPLSEFFGPLVSSSGHTPQCVLRATSAFFGPHPSVRSSGH